MRVQVRDVGRARRRPARARHAPRGGAAARARGPAVAAPPPPAAAARGAARRAAHVDALVVALLALERPAARERLVHEAAVRAEVRLPRPRRVRERAALDERLARRAERVDEVLDERDVRARRPERRGAEEPLEEHARRRPHVHRRRRAAHERERDLGRAERARREVRPPQPRELVERVHSPKSVRRNAARGGAARAARRGPGPRPRPRRPRGCTRAAARAPGVAAARAAAALRAAAAAAPPPFPGRREPHEDVLGLDVGVRDAVRFEVRERREQVAAERDEVAEPGRARRSKCALRSPSGARSITIAPSRCRLSRLAAAAAAAAAAARRSAATSRTLTMLGHDDVSATSAARSLDHLELLRVREPRSTLSS